MKSSRASRPASGRPAPALHACVAPESAEQVVLAVHGGRPSLEPCSARGLDLTVQAPVYLPRGCRLELDLREGGPLERRLTGTVRRVAMVTTDPTYQLVVRLDGGDPRALLGTVLGAEAPEHGPARSEPRAPAAASLPAWTRHLLANGVISREELEELHARTRRAGHPLEQALREVGIAFEAVARCRALDLCVCHVDLADFRIAPSNAALVAPDLARRHGVFPLFALDGVITLGMSDPANLAVIDQVRLRAGSEVEACMCDPEALAALIASAYRAYEGEPPPTALPVARESADGEAANGIIQLVDALVRESAEAGASDVHLEPERDELRVRIRVDGILHHKTSLPRAQHPSVVSRLKVLARLDIAETRRPQDGQFSLRLARGGVDVRVSSLPTVWGENVVLRLLLSDDAPIGLEELGMPPEALASLKALLSEPNGMLLVTGPTGSGKTTTLYAALARLNTMERNVVTVEDPVERRLPLLRQTQVNPGAGVTFASGLRSILRQDPDVIMVGEIRDRETAEIATQAALTGHLVLSTLHTNTAAGALVRLCEVGIPPFLITSSLKAVVSQRLTRRICRACARQEPPDPRLAAGLGLSPAPGQTVLAGAGCRQCLNTGYKGRIGIYEMLHVTPELCAVLLGGESRDAIESVARRALVCELREDGLRQVRAGLTTLAEVARVVGLVPARSPAGSA
jgi:type II secretory ATPase GspE/PulE/Tfp pilus assembly ATPase PilB-like protein